MRSKNRYKGQSTLEYAVITAVVVGALLAIQIYMKRGMQGKLRDSTDQIGEQFDAENTEVRRETRRTGTTLQSVEGGATTSHTGDVEGKGAAEIRTETGDETVGAW